MRKPSVRAQNRPSEQEIKQNIADSASKPVPPIVQTWLNKRDNWEKASRKSDLVIGGSVRA